jgi:hypothetical protein
MRQSKYGEAVMFVTWQAERVSAKECGENYVYDL